LLLRALVSYGCWLVLNNIFKGSWPARNQPPYSDRDERAPPRKPIDTGKQEKKWQDIKVQFAAFAVAKA
jgi:hypothetical protein